jgi:hypothetical protein
MDIDNVFSHHDLDLDQRADVAELRQYASDFAYAIQRIVPIGADQSAAIRKVREALFTANAGIALRGVLALALCLFATACQPVGQRYACTYPVATLEPRECESLNPPPARTTAVRQEREAGGIGMTYTGKLGIEIAPGIVMPMSGGGLQPGFGF